MVCFINNDTVHSISMMTSLSKNSDINECELGLYTEVCDENAVCMNDEGSFTCRCQPSYFGDGRTCESKQTKHTVVIDDKV